MTVKKDKTPLAKLLERKIAKRKKVTDATKAKLPLPKEHPQRKKRKRPAEPTITSKRCPSCRKLILLDKRDGDAMGVHSCYDADSIDRHLERTPSPIAGQPLPANPPTADAPDFRADMWSWVDEPFTVSPTGYRRIAHSRIAHRYALDSYSGSWTNFRAWLSRKLVRLAARIAALLPPEEPAK